MSDPTAPGDDATIQHGEAPETVQGGAVAPDAHAPVAEPGTQNEPAMDMHGTTDEDRIAGIVAQTRADVGDAGTDRIAEVLRQRFADTGIAVGDDRVQALAAEVAQR